MPALAVAQALRAEGAQVSFIGGERAEAQLVPAAGFELHRLRVRGLARRDPVQAARALGEAALAVVRSRDLLGRLGAQAVMGGGGYVAGPVGLAAVSRRVPLVLTEADSHLGLTNRALAPLARRVCLAFPVAGRDGPRYRVTGRPGPAAASDREAARNALGLWGSETALLVFGGSLGARSINQAAFAAFADAPFPVIHVAGSRDFAELASRPRGPRYDLREYLDSHDFSCALAACDLVLARAGGSIFEVAAHARPAILVPYPHATADHQSANARWMADAGAAVVIADADCSAPRLRSAVTALLGDPATREGMARASGALARPHAAADVAGELLAAAHGARAAVRPQRW